MWTLQITVKVFMETCEQKHFMNTCNHNASKQCWFNVAYAWPVTSKVLSHFDTKCITVSYPNVAIATVWVCLEGARALENFF